MITLSFSGLFYKLRVNKWDEQFIRVIQKNAYVCYGKLLLVSKQWN